MGNDYIKNIVNIIFFAIFCTWIAMIVIAQNPIERLNASCAPIHQIQRFLRVSGGLHSQDLEERMNRVGGQMTYTCLYYIVRFFYRDDPDVVAYLREQLERYYPNAEHAPSCEQEDCIDGTDCSDDCPNPSLHPSPS